MAKYIDANALLKAMDTFDKFGFSHSGAFVREPENVDYVPYVHYDDMVKCVEGMPTADVVEKFIDELTKKISERIIQALEANYEIIPKKPIVRCKDCKFWKTENDPVGIECEPGETAHYCDLDLMISRIGDFCSYGERRDNATIH